MKKKTKCIRCEVLERKVINEGLHQFLGPNGLKGLVCETCFEELVTEEEVIYEIKEDERTFGEISEEEPY